MASDTSGREPRGSVPLGLAIAAGALVAVVVAAGSVLGVAWWLLGPAGDPPTAASTSSTSSDLEADGYTVWARNDDGTPVRWDPCAPVELVVAPHGAPEGFERDLEVAVRRIAAATGLDIEVTGTTAERPQEDRPPYQPERYGERWAPVLVAWASPDDPDAPLRDIDRGVATPIAVGVPGDRTYVTGQVVLNRDRDDLAPGFDDRASSWGATLLHELGHVVGLGHVDDAEELMATHPGRGPVRFGEGDLAGLRAVGASHGCLDVPPPQHVEVVGPDR